jgi:hypothetical protein
MRILVCYLIAPGEVYAERANIFWETYKRFDAGADHELLTIVKGNATIPSEWEGDFEHHLNDDGHDISSLQHVYNYYHIFYDYIMWFGSWSRILSDRWLAKLLYGVTQPGVGMCGVAGSYESGISYEYPNPHVRTNAFIFPPKLFQSFRFGLVSDKKMAFEFEHGAVSIYRVIKAKGMRGVIIGADGTIYEESDWPKSKTFRLSEQENLMVGDKQSEVYDNADELQKISLTSASWRGYI